MSGIERMQPPKPEKPELDKERVITLTNRAPIRIKEKDWPIIAQGSYCFDIGASYDWLIGMHIRQHINFNEYLKKDEWGTSHEWRNGMIIHANYNYYDERDPECFDNQKIRVGRIITIEQTLTTISFGSKHKETCGLSKHISEVGNELRERILLEPMKKYVTLVVDKCFAELPARSLF